MDCTTINMSTLKKSLARRRRHHDILQNSRTNKNKLLQRIKGVNRQDSFRLLEDRSNDRQLSSDNLVPWSRSRDRMYDKMDDSRQLHKRRRLRENYIRDNRLKALVHNLLVVHVREKPFEIKTTNHIHQFHRKNFVKKPTVDGVQKILTRHRVPPKD